MATSIASERRKAVDARKARDEAIQRLTEAYISVEEKGETIERLTKELELLKPSGRTMREAERISECVKLKAEIARLEGLVKDLRNEIKAAKTHKASSLFSISSLLMFKFVRISTLVIRPFHRKSRHPLVHVATALAKLSWNLKMISSISL